MTPVGPATPAERGPAESAERRDLAEVLVIRRRWLAGSLVEELTLRNPHPPAGQRARRARRSRQTSPTSSTSRAARGHGDDGAGRMSTRRHLDVALPHDPQDSTRVLMDPRAGRGRPDGGTAGWRLHVPGRGETTVAVSVQPVSAGVPADLERPVAAAPAGWRSASCRAWRAPVPTVGLARPAPARRGRPGARRPGRACGSSTGRTPTAPSWPPGRRGS